MDTPLVMPQLGVDIEEGQVESWLKQPGDAVAKGEFVVVITTPKINLEVESPVAGVLKQIVVEVDDIAKVGATLAIIAAS